MDNLNLSIPLSIDYQILNAKHKHELWISGGLELQYFIPYIVETSASISIDSNDLQLFNNVYKINPNNKFVTGLNLGFYYRYSLANYHQIHFGITSQYNLQNQVMGDYVSLPFKPAFTGKGSFTNPLHYLGWELGYAINNRKKMEMKAKAYKKTKRLSPEYSDTVKNHWELKFNLPLFQYSSVKIEKLSGTENLEHSSQNSRYFTISTEIRKYINQNTSWYSGLEYNLLGYSIGPSPFLDVVDYFSIPVGLNREKPLSNRFMFDIGGGLNININITDKLGEETGVIKFDTLGNKLFTYIKTCTEFNRLSIGFHSKLGMVFNTKNLNKLYLNIGYQHSFFDAYRLNYDLLYNNGSYSLGKIIFKPQYFIVSVGYGVTWKRHRWLRFNQ